jgi:Tfp pilus assembly protein PilF
MQRLAPLDANVACFLGQLEASFHHHESARAHYRHALHCDPTQEDAALALFDLHFNAGEYPQAEAVLAGLRERTRTFHVAVREIWMKLYQGDAETALHIFRGVCECPVDDGAAFKDALNALMTAGLDGAAISLIEQTLNSENANPSLGSYWVLILMQQGRLPSHRRLKRLHKRGEIGRRAILSYVQLLGGTGAEDKVLKRSKCRRLLAAMLRAHGPWLSADEAGWRVVVAALTDLALTARALRWLEGWEQRTDLTPTILHDLVINLKRAGREREVAAVCRRAMDLSRDAATPFLELWLAQEEALAGDFTQAGQRLDKLRFDTFNAYHQQVFILVRSLVEVGRAPARDRAKTFRDQFKDVRRVFGDRFLARSDRPACAAFHRTMTCLAGLSGGWKLRAWAAIRMH